MFLGADAYALRTQPSFRSIEWWPRALPVLLRLRKAIMTKVTRVSPEAADEAATKTKTVAATRDVDSLTVKAGEDIAGDATAATNTAAKKTAAKKTAAKKTTAKKTRQLKRLRPRKLLPKRQRVPLRVPQSLPAAVLAVQPRMPTSITMILWMTTLMMAKSSLS